MDEFGVLLEPSQFFYNAIESFLGLCRLRPHPAFTAKPLISFGMPVKTCTAASALHIFAERFQRYRVGDRLAFSDLFCRFKLPCGDDLWVFRRTAVVCIGKDQSGQLQNCYAHMEKRGSRYLRYALFNAAKYVCLWCPTFSAYLEKERSEGKHYNVAISHAAKKLVRLIFAMQRSGKAFLADY